MAKGVLLLNLGTPDSPSVPDVRRYLKEFLSDPYVIDAPAPIRWMVVNLFILPTRPKNSAEAYASIWSEEQGSPLLHHSQTLLTAARKQTNLPLALAMRYGDPGIDQALEELIAAGVDDLLLVPLYPQYADSTHTTSIERVRGALPDSVRLTVLPPFYDNAAYIEALAASVRPHLNSQWDHLLLSYHGLPERHLQRTDPTQGHCLRSANCCDTPSPAHNTCYRHQALTTSRLLAEALDIRSERYSVSFQSRLGRLPWLTPYTDARLAELPGEGVRHLVVACPAFVADNLETLEEIGMQGRETFLEAGGESLTLVPCLNDRADWTQALISWCEAFNAA